MKNPILWIAVGAGTLLAIMTYTHAHPATPPAYRPPGGGSPQNTDTGIFGYISGPLMQLANMAQKSLGFVGSSTSDNSNNGITYPEEVDYPQSEWDASGYTASGPDGEAGPLGPGGEYYPDPEDFA